jgi:GIY-YIG catalytic domain
MSDRKLLKPAIYFLTNLEDTKIYIGEAENVYNRLVQHSQQKDFWDIALVAVGYNNEKGDVKYL